MKYTCSICNYVYNEVTGKWEDLPDTWVCPWCGATKDSFVAPKEENETIETDEPPTKETNMHTDRELSFGELSALCSNLSKGCEKQYLPEEADLFNQLSAYFNSKSPSVKEHQFEDLSSLLQRDLNSDFSIASKIAKDEADRGALRALTWSDKVSKILNSLLNRYAKKQDKLLENTNVYVCEICGFIYLGDEKPAICPVCKVPNIKLTQIKRRG